MIKYILIFIAVIGMGILFWQFVADFSVPNQLNPLAASYVSGSAADLRMPNVVTAVVVTYRGLDTLGEVTVLFLATAGVALFLKRHQHGRYKRRRSSEIMQTAAGFLTPLIVMFGVYIFIHGHLTPGGGFQGGVVIASGFLLMMMTDVSFKLSHGIISTLESLSGLFYVLLGLAGLALLGFNSFLDPRYIGLGEWGRLFSTGAVPIIYSMIGIKVGSELASMLDSLQTDGEEE